MAEPDFKEGQHVVANFGDGDVVSHYVEGPVTNDAGETKHVVQGPGGKQHQLTYREPGDYDEQGSGSTFRKTK